MKKVICINDSNQPIGANVVKNEHYEVESEHINTLLEQKAYIIKGLCNKGKTRFGTEWYGYNANRFATLDEDSLVYSKEEELELVLN